MEPTVTDQTAAEGLRWSMMALRLEVPAGIVADVQAHINAAIAWVLSEYREVLADELAYLARIAQALGLVDQPPVPRALVDWLREWIKDEPAGSQNRVLDLGTLLAMIEAGEFGPVEGER